MDAARLYTDVKFDLDLWTQPSQTRSWEIQRAICEISIQKIEEKGPEIQNSIYLRAPRRT